MIKSNYRKLTITLPPAMYAELVQESARRKSARMVNASVSAIVTEKAVAYFQTLNEQREQRKETPGA